MGNADRDELRRRLEQLASSEAPKDLSHGAMCYRMAGPPDVSTYVCPVCGNRTVYACKRWTTGFFRKKEVPRPEADRTAEPDVVDTVEHALPYWRTRLRESGAAQAGIELDERAFCRHCSPAAAEPAVALVVRHADRVHRVEHVSGEDVVLVCEFFEGSRKHDLGMRGEIPLKERIGRLQELLGVTVG